jgi:AdoMet-dependent heme synthase
VNVFTFLQAQPKGGQDSGRKFAACKSYAGPPDPYDALLSRLRLDHVPYSVVWELTHACNLKCVMCYNQPLAEPELTTQECLAILNQLAGAGTLHLTLTGGEILARRDFFEIAEEARRLGFALDLKTNGTLITPETADQLAALAPLQVDISLLGAQPATFDRVAGAPRTLERVLRGVELLKARNVRVKLNTLLLDLNIDERRQMAELAARLEVFYEQVFKVSPSDFGLNKAGHHQLSAAEMRQALVADATSFTGPSQAPDSRTCAVGLSSCLISPYGIIYPCTELRIAAGRLRAETFANIWRGSEVFRDLCARHVRGNLIPCRSCALSPYCEGRCAGLAWKEHGDPYGGHTLACWHAQARYGQLHPGEALPDTPVLQGARSGYDDLPSKFPALTPPIQSEGIMETIQTPSEPKLDPRKPWEEPKIVLERLLLVAAQDATPEAPFPDQQGFLGPLNASGVPGMC